jgi:group I intron endonuclease
MSKQGFIYKYTYPNGKVYIGQTRVGVKERHYQHMSASKDPKRRTICEIAIAKYGEPKLEVIETIEVEDNEATKLNDLLNEAEKSWIEKYDSTNRDKGYNIQNGGERITPEEYILQEKWYEIYEKEGWGEGLGYIRHILDNIIEKNGNVGSDGEIIQFHLKNSDLTKEERRV